MFRALLSATAAIAAPCIALAADGDFFEKRIRPVLHEHCVECHGAKKQKGGLRLDSRAAILEGGETGAAVVAGKPDESLLLKAVRQVDKDLSMPPAKAGPKFADAVIADIAEWIKAGAVWPLGDAPVASVEKETFDLEARKQRLPWIWQTPQRQTEHSDVDGFSIAKLREKGLAPAPPTDDLTWLRRVHFAIPGLPPQREEMRAFLDDASQQRRERVVDALLASPHFGERWARHWMDATLLGSATAPACAASADYFRERDDIAKTIRWDSPTAVSWADGTGVDEHILIRGKPTRTGDHALRGLPEAFGLPRIAPADSSGRAELARQLTDPANPLVARVIVNRVWHHLFGRGLVPTVDNFGYLGERPSHPELLDHLAWQLVHEDGWSLKRLIKRLTLTSTFAMSSRAADARAGELDPANVLLHQMPVRRLEGEGIRDALLVVSGRLDPKLFGPPVLVHLTDFIVGRGRPGSSGPLDGAGRRSIYTAVRRNFVPTMMLAFDRPTPFSTVGRRNVTNVPAQSLVVMNDPFVREQATVWAARLGRELPIGDDGTRIAWLFETACARPPAPDETSSPLESLAELRTLHAGQPDMEAWSDLCHALLNANDFIYLK